MTAGGITGTVLQSDVISIADAHDPSTVLSPDVIVPAGKMDADNYMAEDLDGVTQSLFGSGNLNYLTLQGRETDEMMAAGAGELRLNDMEHTLAENAVATLGAHAMTDTRDIGLHEAHAPMAAGETGAHDAQTLSSLLTGTHSPALAALSGGAGGVLGFSGGALDGVFSHGGGGAGGLAHAGAAGHDGASGVNGIDGTGGGAGAGGGDGHDGSGITIAVDVDVTVNHALSPVENIVNNTVDDTTTLIDNSVHDATTLIDNTLGDALGDVTNIVNAATGDVASIVNNLLGAGGNGDIDLYEHNDLGLPQVNLNLDPVEAIVGDINTGVGITHDAQGATVNVDALAAGLPLAHASLPIDAPVVGQVLSDVPDTEALLHNPIGAATDAVSDISNTLTALADVPSVHDIVQDPTSAIGGTVDTVLSDVSDVLAPPASGDADLFVHNDLGLPQVDVGLDPVENIVGDTDIGVDVTHGADGGITLGTGATALGDSLVSHDVTVADGGLAGDVTAPVTQTANDIVSDPAGAVASLPSTITDAVGNIAGDVASGVPQDNSASDTDLSVHNDMGLPQVDVNLDPVESVTGDIDIGVDASHTDSALGVGASTVALGGTLLDTGASVMDGGLAGNTVTDVAHDVAGGALTGTVGDILDNASAMDATAGGAQGVLDSASPTTGGDTIGALTGDLTGATDTLSAGSDASLWPQTDATGISPDVAGALGGVLGGDADATSSLPSPEGSVGEGLGLIDTGGDHGGSALSGLGGAVHHGLFG